MKTSKEYPAGHSVDTTWFAVDKKGMLGQMFTGEEGWIPIEYPKNNNPYLDVDKALLMDISEPIAENYGHLLFTSEAQDHLRRDLLNEPKNPWEKNWEAFCDDTSATELYPCLLYLAPKVHVQDLRIWTHRVADEENAIFDASDDRSIVLVYSWHYQENAFHEDLLDGRILKYCPFFDLNIGIPFECDDQGWTYAFSDEEPSFPLQIASRAKENQKIAYWPVSFESKPTIDMLEYFYHLHTGETTTKAEDLKQQYERMTSSERTTALFKALEQKQEREIAVLLSNYPDMVVSATDKDGITFVDKFYRQFDTNSDTWHECVYSLVKQYYFKRLYYHNRTRT